MKNLCCCTGLWLLLCAMTHEVTAQAELPKTEVDLHFTLLNVARVTGRVSEPGVGARIAFNPARLLGLEGEINFFPSRGNGGSNLEGGRITQGLFGAKLGWRREKVGLFGKIRPGFLSYGAAVIGVNNTVSPTIFEQGRLTHFALDAGGVLEFYPSRRTLLRFDLGDTMIRFGHQTYNSGVGYLSIAPHTQHNLQFSVGAGIRF